MAGDCSKAHASGPGRGPKTAPSAAVAGALLGAALILACDVARSAGETAQAGGQAAADPRAEEVRAAPPATSPDCGANRVCAAIRAIGPAVERLAARTKPLHWECKRACLYYALAGQRLLAAQGIRSTLYFGDALYAPGTRACHSISPHAWLQTAGYFIDYATLPRSGAVTVLAAERVAHSPAEVEPGRTAVLAVPERPSPRLEAFLRYHDKRFAFLSQRPSMGLSGPRFDPRRNFTRPVRPRAGAGDLIWLLRARKTNRLPSAEAVERQCPGLSYHLNTDKPGAIHR